MYAQRLEAHPWFDAGKTLDAASAFRMLAMNKKQHIARKRCVYVHVPFCESICSFCALYTKAVKHDHDIILDDYLKKTLKAIRTHPYARLGKNPTTVHFGGGTPLRIGFDRFSELTHGLRDAFGHDSNTEWAIEVTTSSVSEKMLNTLKSLDFSRIHLGIQTLDDNIRRAAGRRESKQQCLDKVNLAKEAGFLLSVDLIIGLDGMTESTILNDLELLYEAGVRMFSICELRHRSNRQHIHLHTPDRIELNRRLWNIIWAFMSDNQLKPIHIGQFGRDYEDNLYFTHPARQEECIAIGPYAHGSVGNIYYSNKLLPEYINSDPETDGLIQHAVLYPDDIQTIRQLESELLAHKVSQQTIINVSKFYGEGFSYILSEWVQHDLLRQIDENNYALSCEGSWYVGNMCLHLRQLTVHHYQHHKHVI